MSQLNFQVESLAQDEIARINYDSKNRISISETFSRAYDRSRKEGTQQNDIGRASEESAEKEDRSNPDSSGLQENACEDNIQKQLTVNDFFIWYYERVKAIHEISEEAFDIIVSEHYIKKPR